MFVLWPFESRGFLFAVSQWGEHTTAYNLHAIGRCEVTNGQISLALNKHNGFSPEEECHSACTLMCVFSINCFLSNKFVAVGHHAECDMSPLFAPAPYTILWYSHTVRLAEWAQRSGNCKATAFNFLLLWLNTRKAHWGDNCVWRMLIIIFFAIDTLPIYIRPCTLYKANIRAIKGNIVTNFVHWWQLLFAQCIKFCPITMK